MLPTQYSQFTQAEYWNEFFEARRKAAAKGGKSSAFEWYGDFKDDLLSLVKDLHQDSNALVLGCGNSTLSEDLVKTGCASRVVSVDFSEKAIEEMEKKTKGDARLVWLLADVTKLPQEFDSSFDCVWDKGALDAILGEVGGDENSSLAGKLMLEETVRCLKPGGIYFCVSLLQEHVLKTLLDSFYANEQFESLRLVPFVPKSDSVLCPFLLLAKKRSGEVSPRHQLFVKSSNTAVSDRKSFERIVIDTQVAYGAKRSLNAKGVIKKEGLKGTFSVASASNPTSDRFRLQIIDTNKKKIPFAALILPQGREHEWSFSHEEGQLQIAQSNEIGRLIFVSLGRGESFPDGMEGVQRELAHSIMEFAPLDLPKTFKVPYLAVAQDLGQRTVVFSGESEVSGKFTVEDVRVGEETHRRLIFLNNPLAIQSECRILDKDIVDLDHLSFEFHRAMCALGFALRQDSSTTSVDGLVCGLGGGGLLSFLARRFPRSSFMGVEIDSAVVDVARKCFSLIEKPRPDGQPTVHVGDAFDFLLKRLNKKDLDLVMIDINGGMDTDSKEQTSLRFPPPQFLDQSFLEHVRDSTLRSDDGMMVLNFGCRSPLQTKTLLQRLKDVFGNVVALDMSEVSGDLNIILACSRGLDLKDGKVLDRFVAACEKDDLGEGLRIVQADGSLGPLRTVAAEASAGKKKNKNKKKKKN